MAAGSQHRCVFVGNIPYDATEEQLVQICEEVGPVVSFRLVVDRETGKPKGYGFCEYKDEETALSARRNLQGYEINGRQLRVDFAENDKGADRNREQGRGGPGLTANIDAQKSVGGPSILGDLTLHQPIGLQLAANAASVMARALGGAQTASLLSVQNGLPSQSGAGNDPLTHYLAKMSRHQLNEIVSEMKALATQNKALTQQLLQGNSHLPKALFQAQIMLGIVSPQMLQMASIRQAPGPVQKPTFQDSMQDKKPILSSHPGQTPLQKEAHVGIISRPSQNLLSNVAQTPLTLQESAPPFQHVPIQPQVQQQLPPQDQLPLGGAVPGMSEVPKVPIRPQSLGGPSQLKTPPLPNPKSLIPQIQPPLLQHPRPVGTATFAQQPQIAPPDANLHQTIVPQPLTPQFPPEVESALWQQVMNLTPEQLSSLPREQQEQVFQLQKALQQQVTNINPSS